MFVIAPAGQPVIPMIDDRYAFFPVRRIYSMEISENGCRTSLLCPDAVLPVGLKEVGQIQVDSDESVRVRVELVAAIGCNCRWASVSDVAQGIYAWAAAMGVVRSKNALAQLLPVSALRKRETTVNPAQGDMWMYVNQQSADKILLNELSIYEAMFELSRQTTLQAGDLISISASASGVDAVAADVIRVGVTGVGMLTMEIKNRDK